MLLEPRKPADAIRPRIQAVPGAIEPIFFRIRQPGHGEIAQHPIENQPMQAIQLRPRHFPATHAVHRGRIAGAPGVGKLCGVDSQSFASGKLLHFRGDRRAPVDDGAEHVEDQRLDRAELPLRHSGLLRSFNLHSAGEVRENGQDTALQEAAA